MTVVDHWASVLELRPEVVARRGHAEGLQMSLYDAVYQTSDVPYHVATYWCDITEPTTKLVEFMAEICRQLAGGNVEGELLPGGDSLFHLDQGMGGGKSHALVGLWHLARNPAEFFASDIGVSVRSVAERRSGRSLELSDVRIVVLCADYFSPGVARPEFGPATNLHQRFLWSLFDGERALYDQYVAAGIDKAALKDAITAAGRPVLILLDEIMDYAMRLAGPDERDTIPAEQAFLNALTGVVNEVPSTAMVLVMIRSDLDEQGYEGPAADFRSYLSKRLERNGTSVSVNEPQDFGAIIRRRIFTRPVSGGSPGNLPQVEELAARWAAASSSAWREHVFDRLPGARQLSGFGDRLDRSYPFHPDLLDLVEHDWTQHAGFQRVRSTVEVFAASAYWWSTEHLAGRWAPELIGVGDIPLHTAMDEVLSSGLLHGNERQIVGMRQVAEKDVTSADQTDGQAVLVDRRITDGRGWASLQPFPSVRLATALWMYSIAVRAQGRRGATKPELLAAIYVPDEHFTFADADEVFNALTDDEDERGLGALDVLQGGGGGTPARYLLVTQLNKRMFQRNALNRTSPENSYELIWERVLRLASKGSGFDSVIFIEKPDRDAKPLKDIFADVDQRRSNRLVVLDPRRWALLNGRDSSSRADIQAILGLAPDEMTVDFGASCVIACVNTQRRDTMVKRARSAYAWRLATGETDRELDLYAEMVDEAKRSFDQLDTEVRRAYQHYAYLVRDEDGLRTEFIKFEDDQRTSLSGNDVWEDLAHKGDAVRSADGLAGSYLHQLLDLSSRNYTLAEVVEKFWRDPAFPIIPSDSVARRAIFDALRPDADSVAWELVTSAGEPLHVGAPEQLLLNSSDQCLRVAQPSRSEGEAQPASAMHIGGQAGTRLPGFDSRDDPHHPEVTGSPSIEYKIYELSIANRSLSDRDAREKLFQLLGELADVVDPTSGADIQVATIKVELNAAGGSLDRLGAKAAAADAHWEARAEDF
ncbi:MAG: DUF499 domain-containing protein [Acidimicrobiales bacterium]